MQDGGFLILSDVLCFAVKSTATTHKTLKSSLFDFYTMKALSDAKKLLCNNIDKMNLSIKRLHLPSRQDNMPSLRLFDGDTHIILKKNSMKLIRSCPNLGQG